MDLILEAKWILPIVPENTALLNHSIVVKDGKILDILRTEEVNGKYTAAEHFRGEGESVLLPGLINAHTHTPMALLRSYAEDLPLMEWLTQHIWPAEGAHVSADFCRVGSKLAVAEMLRCGITCFSDMYFFPEETAAIVLEVGSRACIGMPVIAFPNAWAQTPAEHLEKGLAVRHRMEDKNHLFFFFAPHAPYTVDDETLAKIHEHSSRENIRVHTHLHETATEISDSERDHKVRPFERLRRLGLINERLIAVHMTQLTDEEIDTLRSCRVGVVHCPESNLKLGSGLFETKKLVDAGVTVGIGTDGPASNDDQDILGEIRTANFVSAYLTQSRGQTPLNAHTFLEMATINNAKLLGLDHLLGSLEIGKAADIIAVNLRSVPVYNPIKHLAQVGTNDVTDVWVGGKRMVSAGELVCINESALREESKVLVESVRKTYRPTIHIVE